MIKLKDYQWPSSFIRNPKFINNLKNKAFKNKRDKIEDYFSYIYGNFPILFPSARAAIAAILRYLKFDRSNEVFINKWVSHCIFNTVGAFTNISTNLVKPDLIICVHKWGYEQIISKKLKSKYIIEDSVDSIFLNKSGLFRNDGDYELFSLPKIIGSVSGSIILTKNRGFYNYCKSLQNQNRTLGIYQSEQKFLSYKKNNSFNTWLYHESWNTTLEHNGINDIYKNLVNFEKNKNFILKRRDIFKNETGITIENSNRIGPIIAIPLERLKNFSKLEKFFLIRHIHSKKNIVNKFKKVILLPVHFKISNNKFNFYLDKICKNLR